MSAEEDSRRIRRVLTEPLLLARGESIIDSDIIVSHEFRRTSNAHVLTVHPEGNKIRNTRILFETDVWSSEWQLPIPGQPDNEISSGVSGLYIPIGAQADIDGLHVEGAPRFGLEAYSVSSLKLRRFSSTRCYMGAFVGRPTSSGILPRLVDVDQVRVWDTWGPPGGYPSRVRPGGWVGGDGWVNEGDKVSLKNFEISGEMFVGMKISRGTIVTMDGITTPSIMFQGSSSPTPGEPGLSFVYVKNLFLNAATGYGLGADEVNKIQISWNVAASFDGGYIIGNGSNGNGIQITGNCHVSIRDFVIGGFNGFRGVLPACALEINSNSSVNSDVQAVNRFFNQRLILRNVS
jgi:hypothetical protein